MWIQLNNVITSTFDVYAVENGIKSHPVRHFCQCLLLGSLTSFPCGLGSGPSQVTTACSWPPFLSYSMCSQEKQHASG